VDSQNSSAKAAKNFITTKEEVDELSQKLSSETYIAVDTEFIRETTFYPKIALIQVATDKEGWLLDPTVLDESTLKPVFDVFRNPKILKIMHAAFADQECFYTTYRFIAEPVLDTAVAGALLGLGDNLGLGRLLKELLNVYLPKGRARARWLHRPLSPELMAYAEQDVVHLVELGRVLEHELTRRNRFEWALEESAADIRVFDITPEEMAEKMSKSGQLEPVTVNTLLELLKWREDRAKRANLPRGWVADNETVLALARSRPRSIDELRSFRGLSPKEVDRSGTVILDSIQRGIQAPREKVPHKPRLPPRTEREEHILDFVQTYVALLGSQHEIAVRFLLNSAKAHLCLRPSEDPKKFWTETGIMSNFAWDLIGPDLLELLEGRKGLALKNGQVVVLPLAAT
jgi:ribonuclease D